MWELREVLLRYSPSAGSSRGVREFVETGLLTEFARNNPQVQFKTQLHGGHPCVYGHYSKSAKNVVVCPSPPSLLVVFSPLSSSLPFMTLIPQPFRARPTSVTGYKRQRTLKNEDAEVVRSCLQELRDTLGRKVPRHNEISRGVLERKTLSVQGVWRNTVGGFHDTRRERDRRLALGKTYGLGDILEDIGMTGVVEVTQQLMKEKEEMHQAAIARFPVKKRVRPTE